MFLQALPGTVSIFIVATYTDGTPCEDAQWFYKWLEDSVNDFRLSKYLLEGVRYAVFGLGNSLYQENYNVVGKNIDKWLSQLGAERYAPLGLGDENVAASLQGSIEADFDHWCEGFLHLIKNKKEQKKGGCSKGNNCCSKKKKRNQASDENEQDIVFDTSDESECEEPVVDLEDLGRMVRVEAKQENDNSDEEEIPTDGEPREMLTPQLREALSKQGYRLIGSHSGVKLCRWTKVR